MFQSFLQTLLFGCDTELSKKEFTKQPEKHLVLDIDETLIRAQTTPFSTENVVLTVSAYPIQNRPNLWVKRSKIKNSLSRQDHILTTSLKKYQNITLSASTPQLPKTYRNLFIFSLLTLMALLFSTLKRWSKLLESQNISRMYFIVTTVSNFPPVFWPKTFPFWKCLWTASFSST